MIVNFLLTYLLIGTSVVYSDNSEKNEEKDTKDKRQIGLRQTSINPHQQQPGSRLDTVYGSHPNQFVIRAIGQPLQDFQHQKQQHNNGLQPEQAAEVSQQYAFIQELQPIQGEKTGKSHGKHPLGKPNLHQFAPERQQQYIQQYQQPIQQYQLVNPQEELLKFFQDEIALRAISLNNPKRSQTQNKQQINQNNPKQGLENYREPQVHPENQELFAYIQENVPQQQYYHQIPIDYHKSIPNHPLAASSLEKELEKLVASNKPYQQQQHQQPSQHQPIPYKPPKLQQPTATYSTATPVAVPTPQEKIFSFFPDFAQLSGFKPTSEIYFNGQLQEQPKTYPVEAVEREQKPRKVTSGGGQYLTEKQKYKQTQPSLQQKQVQIYNSQQKEQQNYAQAAQSHRNAAVKIIEAPSLNYEKSQITPAPLISYYKAESTERPEQSIPQQNLPHSQPSTSSIFVSQGTGLRSTPLPPQPTKNYNEEKYPKLPQLPPLDGKPLTQEEFQALVDAGYPVTAVPVPVPVPYEEYIKQSAPAPAPHHQHFVPEDHSKDQRRQPRPVQKQSAASVTYLRPIRLQQEQERHYPQRTSA